MFDEFADYGKFACPHCGHAMNGEADSVYLSHALSPEEEEVFNIQHPLNAACVETDSSK
jgi:hypothetical protein